MTNNGLVKKVNNKDANHYVKRAQTRDFIKKEGIMGSGHIITAPEDCKYITEYAGKVLFYRKIPKGSKRKYREIPEGKKRIQYLSYFEEGDNYIPGYPSFYK